VRAAIHYERSDNHVARARVWSAARGAARRRQAGEEYAAGLRAFTSGAHEQKTGDDRAAHRATVAAVHRLEAAADRFEAVGQRERAFDCFTC
jgi:hypothetical protein